MADETHASTPASDASIERLSSDAETADGLWLETGMERCTRPEFPVGFAQLPLESEQPPSSGLAWYHAPIPTVTVH